MNIGYRRIVMAVHGFMLMGVLSGCGGGSASSGSTQPTGDFSISVTPTTISLMQNATMSLSVSVAGSGGFSSTVSVTVAGLPPGVSATPSSFSLRGGGTQTVSLAATAAAVAANVTVTFNAVSGTLNHSTSAATQIVALPTTRLRFFNTGSVLFNSAQIVIYNAGARRFFFADQGQNQIFVFDAKAEQQLSSIFVPSGLSLDQSADGSEVYAATATGSIYVIDPAALAIKERIEPGNIGPTGFQAFGVAAMANGSLILLGAPNVVPAELAAFTEFAVWQRSTNTLTTYRTTGAPSSVSGQSACGNFFDIGSIRANAARTKVYMGSYSGATAICQFDPASGQSTTSANAEPSYLGGTAVLPTPDDQNFITFSYGNVVIWDASTMAITDQFSYPVYLSAEQGVLSVDGNTLYTAPTSFNAGLILAYNWRTHAMIGWVNEPVAGLNGDLTPMAIDETGLIGGIGGVLPSGFGFADVSSPQVGPYLNPLTGLGSGMGGPFITPQNVGPVGGGGSVQFNGVGNQTPTGLYFGGEPATQWTAGSNGVVTGLAPSHAAGPVDVSVTTSEGAVFVAFSAYSYGPVVTDSWGTVSTAEGGGTARAIGYGLGLAYTTGSTPNPQVQVGTQPAQVSAFWPNIGEQDGVPQQAVDFTIPVGTAGTKAQVTISNAYGSATLSAPLTYLPAVQTFPLPADASLAQGVYDAAHQLYYFTDLTQIRVFSRASLAWQTPISLPNPRGGTQEFVGIAMSPDGSKLAVSDDGTNSIYVLNTSTLAVSGTFALPNTGLDAGNEPCGLAISDAGMVYYATYQSNGVGNHTFHKLDTGTGVVTAYAAEGASNQYDQYDSHVLISKDNSSVYYLGGDVGSVYKVNTATDQGGYVPNVYASNSDMAFSVDGTTLVAGGALFDQAGNSLGSIGSKYVYEVDSSEIPVDGEKFSLDGKLLFQPQEQSLQIVDVATAMPVQRLALPVKMSLHFDSLVADGVDNVLAAITDPGNGIALIDVSGVPEPAAARPGAVLPLRKRDAGSKAFDLLGDRPVLKGKVGVRAMRRLAVGRGLRGGGRVVGTEREMMRRPSKEVEN